ncbi:hypothetical protein T03_5836 [Trichinella britovi]|uniref:Uncharacterized protein n=1 Tax=Trichinella britovi TaxID=45882 RepID=A0A0V1CQW3_TRIBR|nr:hypothetical protein T03_5836 [Trichinella britovi]
MQLNLRHSKSISNYIIAGSIYNKGSNICIYVLTVENSQDLLLEDEFFKPSARKWNIEMIIYAGALENLKAQKHICKQCGLPMNELLCKNF